MLIHKAEAIEVLKGLGTSPEGLSSEEALKRLNDFGPNVFEHVAGRSHWKMLAGQFTHFLAILLFLGAFLAFLADYLAPGEGMASLGFAILGVIAVNGFFSFWQEFRAEKTLEALSRILPKLARVRRDGFVMKIPAEDIVPGDVLVFEAGDNVGADCRVLYSLGLKANFATVTGESLPKARDAAPSREEEFSRADNALLAGTSIVAGRGSAVAVATGSHTEFNKIAHFTQTGPPSPSPLQLEIAATSRMIGLAAIAIGASFFLLGQLTGLSFWSNFTFAVGIIVAFVPEGLLPTVTLSLAMACQRMADRNALVRHMPAVEALGSATVILTDKTGTLTENRMSVKLVHVNGVTTGPENMDRTSPAGILFLKVAGLCHDLTRAVDRKPSGDPMEIALAEMAGFMESGARIDEFTFDTTRKRMSVLAESDGETDVFTKGAPETVLPLCRTQLCGGERSAFSDYDREKILAEHARMASMGLRVLALAVKRVTGLPRQEEWEKEMVFLGLVALRDPPRPEVPEAISKCRSAGIRIIMVTGDHPSTALAIARETGMVTSDAPLVITGDRLRKLSPAELGLSLNEREIIFARLTAGQKLSIVTALKRKGEIVAVTGDGVNDAPALKHADIGIAMGLGGTEVARESADMVLLDDNFATIVKAIEEGRMVFGNLKKFLRYILASNIPEAVPFLGFVLLGIPLPLTIIQILAVDLGTDLLPALALGAEKADSGVMDRPPRPRRERLLSLGLLAHSYLFLGPMEACAAMAAFFHILAAGGWSWGITLPPSSTLYMTATTATLAAIVLCQVANLFLCRSVKRPFYSLGLSGNRLIIWGAMSQMLIILMVVYTPLGWRLFKTAPLPPGIWLYMIPFAAAMMVLEETRKYVARAFTGRGA